MAAGPALRLVSRCATVEEFVRAFRDRAGADTLEVPFDGAAPAARPTGRVVVALANRIAVIDGDAELTIGAGQLTIRYTRLDVRSRGLLAHLVEVRDREVLAPIPRHLVPLGAPAGDPTTAGEPVARCVVEPLAPAASVPRLPDAAAAPRPTLARGIAMPALRNRPPTGPAPLSSTPAPLSSTPLPLPLPPAPEAGSAPARARTATEPTPSLPLPSRTTTEPMPPPPRALKPPTLPPPNLPTLAPPLGKPPVGPPPSRPTTLGMPMMIREAPPAAGGTRVQPAPAPTPTGARSQPAIAPAVPIAARSPGSAPTAIPAPVAPSPSGSAPTAVPSALGVQPGSASTGIPSPLGVQSSSASVTAAAPTTSPSGPVPAAPVLPVREGPEPARPRRRRESQPTLMGVGSMRQLVDPDTDPNGQIPEVSSARTAAAAALRPRGPIESTFHGPAPIRIGDITTPDATPAPHEGGPTIPTRTFPHVIAHELDTGETDVHTGDDLITDVAYALPELPGMDDLDPLVEPPAPSSPSSSGMMSVSKASAVPRPVRRPASATVPTPAPNMSPAPLSPAKLSSTATSSTVGSPSPPPPVAAVAPPAPPVAPEPAPVAVAPVEPAVAPSIPDVAPPPMYAPSAEAAPMYAIPSAPDGGSGQTTPMFAPAMETVPVSSAAAPHPSAWPTPGWSPPQQPQPQQPPPPQPAYQAAPSYPGYPAPPPAYPGGPPSYPPPQQNYATAQLPALDYHAASAPVRPTPAMPGPAWRRHHVEVPDAGDMTEIISAPPAPRRRRWPVIAITSAIVVALVIVALAMSQTGADSAGSAGSAGTGTEEPGPGKPLAPAKVTAPDGKPAVPDGQPAVPDGQPAVPDGKPATGSDPGACRIAFSSSPASAEVVLAGKVLGVTPITVELPCQPASVAVRRDRYQTVTRRVEPHPGEHAVMVKLARPTFTVMVRSVPSRAKVTVGGAAAGLTPTKITVPGFEGTAIEITKSGFGVHRERVYASKPGQIVNARLRRR